MRVPSGVAFHEGNAEALPFADGSFDAVYANLSLQLTEHPETVLREVWRVLRPGARAAFSVWGAKVCGEGRRVPPIACRSAATK